MGARAWRDLDWLALALTAAVCAVGLAAIAGASGRGLHDPTVIFRLKRQVMWYALGLAVLAMLAATDYHLWARWWAPLYAGALLLLLAVMAVGHHSYGAQRWISLGPLDLQPSEFSKLAVILALAVVLSARAGRMRRWKDVLLPAACVALPGCLVALQPDLGTSLVFGVIFIGMVYAAGFSGWRMLLGLLLLAGGVVGLVLAHLHWPHRVPLPLHAYQLKRLLAFVNPGADPLGNGYHILQSEMAIGSGRLLGNGLFSGGAGGQLTYLPAAYTDFVFAAVGDTLGFAGAAGVLVALSLIVWRAIACMGAARDALGGLIAAGVACMLGFETLLNVAMTMGMMPVTGVPLPFTSYGGSAALVNFAAVGLMESVYLRRRRIRF